MPKRLILIAMTVTFLIAVIPFNTYSQRRQRSSGRPARQTSVSPLTREAELENQRFWEKLYVKCGDSYFGEVAPGLSQMRMVTFSISARQLTEVDRENGYEWRGSGVMRFGRRRMLTFGRWSDWVAANEDWMTGGNLTAILQKKNGEWSAVYSPFDRNIIAKRPTCEGLSQFGIEANRPTVQPTPAPRPTPKSQVGVREVTVSNFGEFVAAIAPNTTIKMRPGYYTIDPIGITNNEYVSFAFNRVGTDDMSGQSGLTIKNVSNLSIIGLSGNERVQFLQPNQAWTVLIFKDSSNVVIDNIKAGHDPRTEWCTAGVLTFYDSRNIKISNVDLYGSGLVGLNLYNVQGLDFIQSTIRDCSYLLMEIGYNSDGIRFKNSRFINSGLLDLIQIKQSSNVSFSGVEISGNKSKQWSEVIFLVEDSKNVSVTNSKIKGNDVGWLEFAEGSVQFDSSNEIDLKQFRNGKSKHKR